MYTPVFQKHNTYQHPWLSNAGSKTREITLLALRQLVHRRKHLTRSFRERSFQLSKSYSMHRNFPRQIPLSWNSITVTTKSFFAMYQSNDWIYKFWRRNKSQWTFFDSSQRTNFKGIKSQKKIHLRKITTFVWSRENSERNEEKKSSQNLHDVKKYLDVAIAV